MSKRKLLLADDSVTIQKVVNLTFTDEGIEVIAVSDGDTALERIEEMSPDLIMVDVNMPGLNGYEICEKVRNNPRISKTPVILLVGSFEPFDEAEAKRVGADDFLTKPFQSIRQLVNKVVGLINTGVANAGIPQPIEESSVEFANTLEMEKPAEGAVQGVKANFGDNGMDDEMIQTSQISPFSFDEASKFELKNSGVETERDDAKNDEVSEVAERPKAELTKTVLESPTYIEPVFKPYSATETDQSKPVENPTFETKESAFTMSNPFPIRPVETGFRPVEQEFGVATKSQKIESEELPIPETASILDIEDDDILQLPPIESDFEEPDEKEQEFPSTSGKVAEVEEIAPIDSTQTSGMNISPDLIDAIAQRVMEKLSYQTVKDVAWEVVPQMTEQIVKKMAEEKLKG